MSKSLKRVTRALADHGLDIAPVEMPAGTRSAAEAAAAVGCEIDQIVKSVIFRGTRSGRLLLFLTAGGRQVRPDLAAAGAGEPLDKAGAEAIRAETGFAIGGVAPVGLLTPVPAFWDARLSDFPVIWAAAGTPRHVFGIAPAELRRITGAQDADFAS